MPDKNKEKDSPQSLAEEFAKKYYSLSRQIGFNLTREQQKAIEDVVVSRSDLGSVNKF